MGDLGVEVVDEVVDEVGVEVLDKVDEVEVVDKVDEARQVIPVIHLLKHGSWARKAQQDLV